MAQTRASTSPHRRTEYTSLNRGLEILSHVQETGSLKIAELARQLDLPLSTTYRYVSVLRESGYVIEIDGHLLPSNRLAERSGEVNHLVHYARPVLRRLRIETHLTAVLAVRIHSAAVCLDVSFAHPKHKISFQRGKVRPLYAGASALPLLAFAPRATVREVLEGAMRRYTAQTPDREQLETTLAAIRADGHAVSQGHLTPGAVAVGIPVIVEGRCLCSLSLVGDPIALARVPDLVRELRGGANELLARMPSEAIEEVWLQPDQEAERSGETQAHEY